jgi:hypothetical protein
LNVVGVPWRRAILAIVAAVLALTGVVVALRADGYPAIDATAPRATRWFVDETNGRAVLADGFSGQTLARINLPGERTSLRIAQSASGVAVLDQSSATVRTLDTAALLLGPPQSLSVIAAPGAVVGVGQSGIVGFDPLEGRGVLLPPDGDQVPFEIGNAADPQRTLVTPDGAVMAFAAGALHRITTTADDVLETALPNAKFSLVGASPLVFDTDRRRVRLDEGDWVNLPDGVPTSEIVLQQPGPNADCGWLGGDDHLWCVGEHGFVEDVEIAGLGIDGADMLSIAGNAGALVRRATSTIVRIDWKTATIIDAEAASVDAGALLSMSASIDLIWVDEPDGNHVWAIHPWGINAIDKDSSNGVLIGESGEVIAEGESDEAPVGRGPDQVLAQVEHEPDDNGIDDPPVAVNDEVTARASASVPIAVTANDYDPDGEAIALSAVGEAAHGTVDIASATTVSYQPRDNYLGVDQFQYTIVDGDGTEDTATVTIELLPVDTVNRAPIGSPDVADTAADHGVDIDVLINDIDPERDALRIDTFTVPDIGGTVTETEGSSGLRALHFEPPPHASGTATFTYRPVDSFGAIGESVKVQVDIAPASDDNRPPIVRPDALRVRRDIAELIPVLANDTDPDGDDLRIEVIRPVPPGLDVAVRGDKIQVVVRAGAAHYSPFQYEVDDGQGHKVRGSVLVVLIGDVEPNRAPIANADNATAVTGTERTIDVLANDTDPDGDPVILVSVDQPAAGPGAGTVRLEGTRVRYTAGRLTPSDDPVIDRFSYTISDGNDHTATGEVTVRVLPEAIAAPPLARDDAATTEVDVPVTIDVLRNDVDPSGELPTLTGEPGCAGGGQAVLTTDDRVTFIPPAGQAGVFSCTYQVTNSQGLPANAKIVVSVIAPPTINKPPEVSNEQFSIDIGDSVQIDLLENDSDPDGPASALRVLSSTAPSLGTAERVGRVLTFTAGTVTGPTTITYQVGDDAGGVTTGHVLIVITEPDPQPPIAVDDARTILGPGVATQFDVLANDIDPDGSNDDLALVSVTVDNGNGRADVSGRIVTLTPDPGLVGDVVASYTVIDPDGGTDTGQVTLTVLEIPNRAPLAGDDQAEVATGGTVEVPIALNDSDPDGDPLTYSITTPPDPDLGTAQLSDGNLVFTAVRGPSGTAFVGYTIDDGEEQASATVTITVLPCVATPPDAPDVFLQTGYQQPVFVDVNRYARNGTVVQVTPPLGADNVYTPPAGENGVVSFTYVVRNSCDVEDAGTVTVDVNQDPIGSPYVAQIGRTQQFVIPISVLASDAEPLTIVGLEQAPEWVTLIDQNRSILVDPAGRIGRADFVAVISDPGGLQVRVPVSVELVNLAPVANPDVVRADNGQITFQPLANDSDPDGDAIALQSVPDTLTFANGEVGTIQRLPDDSLSIHPSKGAGTATFTYSVVDQFGLVSPETTVTVIVNSAPTAPAVDVAMAAGTTVTVVVDAKDPDGDPLVLTIDDDPAPLTVVVDGLTLTITAPLEAARTDFALRYTVTDPLGASATEFIQIAVGDPDTTTSPPTTTTTLPPPTTGPTTTNPSR